jgi:hypothetical protein
MKILIPTALFGAALLMSGCSSTAATALDAKTTAYNVNKFAGHDTQAIIKGDGKTVTVTFPKLDNNMGENFAKTACQGSFDYIDTFKNIDSGNDVNVYGGKWKLSNNNCAHYVETTSASFTNEEQMRYLLVDGNDYIIAYDKLGREPIIEGKLSN